MPAFAESLWHGVIVSLTLIKNKLSQNNIVALFSWLTSDLFTYGLIYTAEALRRFAGLRSTRTIMKKSLLLISVIAALFVTGCGNFHKTIIIPRATLQGLVDKKFPIDKNLIIARFTIDTPVIYFKNQNVGIKMNYRGNFLADEIKGYVDVNGRITYKQDKGAFYLTDIIIEEFEVNGLNLSNEKKIKNVIQNIANHCLEGFPLYKLNQKKFRQKIAKIFLKNLTIKGEELVIRLGS